MSYVLPKRVLTTMNLEHSATVAEIKDDSVTLDLGEDLVYKITAEAFVKLLNEPDSTVVVGSRVYFSATGEYLGLNKPEPTVIEDKDTTLKSTSDRRSPLFVHETSH